MNDKRIIGYGEYLFDFHKKDNIKVPGGAPPNALYHAMQFDHFKSGVLITSLGEDKDGDELMHFLEGKGLDLSRVQRRADLPTGLVIIDKKDPNSPEFEIKTECAWSGIVPFDGMRELASGCDAFLYGSLSQVGASSRFTLYSLLSMLPPTAKKVCDINLRYRNNTELICSDEILLHSIAYSSILKVNGGEMSILAEKFGFEFDAKDIPASAKDMMDRFPNIELLIITLGTEGSWIVSSEGEESFCSVPRIRLANAVGAGDAFTGSFLANYLDGKPLREAHQIAVNVSAYVCTQPGAMPQIPEWVKQLPMAPEWKDYLL